MANWTPSKITKEKTPDGGRRVLVDYSTGEEHFQQAIPVTPNTTQASIEDAIIAQLRWFAERDAAFVGLSEKVTSEEDIIGAISIRPVPVKPPPPPVPEPVPPTQRELFWTAYQKLKTAKEALNAGVKIDERTMEELVLAANELYDPAFLGL